uniref:Uncharacterized protein n=1 Tax=Arundo donax TaxID=35708 RepID=A0A0A8Z5K3_ARUDO
MDSCGQLLECQRWLRLYLIALSNKFLWAGTSLN